MNHFENYYNGFYKELSVIDERSNTFDKIKMFLPELRQPSRIADIGCGHGSVSYKLIAQGHQVYGFEINEDALQSLRDKGFVAIKQDITQPLETDATFDVVLLLDVLEHVCDPLSLLLGARNILNPSGVVIISVPLYFDILDRLKILFTGSVISLDNYCYGEEIYNRFRSYNYDHLRFYRPCEVLEMVDIAGMKVDRMEYAPTTFAGKNIMLKILAGFVSNRYTVKLNPNLLAHSMKLRLTL